MVPVLKDFIISWRDNTCKQQLEYNCYNESLYKLQYAIRQKQHTNLPPFGAGKGRRVGRGSAKSSQRRYFDRVFTREDLVLFMTSSKANSPQNVPITPGKYFALFLQPALHCLMLDICICILTSSTKL